MSVLQGTLTCRKKNPLAPALVGLPVLGGRPKRNKSREAGIKIGEKKEVSLIMCQCPALHKEPLHSTRASLFVAIFKWKKKKKAALFTVAEK